MTATQDTVSGMPGRYALALFELAQEEKKIAPVGKDLDQFASLVEKSDDLMRLVKSPVFGADEQTNALEAVLAKAKISGIAANFIKLAAKNRRLFAVLDMIRAYRALVSKAKGEITAEVTSAEKLTPAQITKIKTSLKAAVGQDVKLVTHIDSEILGGLIVKVGSRMVDNSLRTKLQSMKIAMKGA
jgi:F-type H+-transporting ATPase subunit delta